MSTELTTGLGILVLALIIVRQVQTRQVRTDTPVVLRTLLVVWAVAGLFFGLASVHFAVPVEAVALLAAMLLTACLAGWVRALTIKLWAGEDGQAMRQGTVLTVVLWLASFSAHYGLAVWLDHLVGTGQLGRATIFVYLAISLTTQEIVLRRRARHYSSNVTSGGATRNKRVR
jgi:hypothetical protein